MNNNNIEFGNAKVVFENENAYENSMKYIKEEIDKMLIEMPYVNGITEQNTEAEGNKIHLEILDYNQYNCSYVTYIIFGDNNLSKSVVMVNDGRDDMTYFFKDTDGVLKHFL